MKVNTPEQVFSDKKLLGHYKYFVKTEKNIIASYSKPLQYKMIKDNEDVFLLLKGDLEFRKDTGIKISLVELFLALYLHYSKADSQDLNCLKSSLKIDFLHEGVSIDTKKYREQYPYLEEYLRGGYRGLCVVLHDSGKYTIDPTDFENMKDYLKREKEEKRKEKLIGKTDMAENYAEFKRGIIIKESIFKKENYIEYLIYNHRDRHETLYPHIITESIEYGPLPAGCYTCVEGFKHLSTPLKKISLSISEDKKNLIVEKVFKDIDKLLTINIDHNPEDDVLEYEDVKFNTDAKRLTIRNTELNIIKSNIHIVKTDKDPEAFPKFNTRVPGTLGHLCLVLKNLKKNREAKFRDEKTYKEYRGKFGKTDTKKSIDDETKKQNLRAIKRLLNYCGSKIVF